MWTSPAWLLVRTTAPWPTSPSRPSPLLRPRDLPLGVLKPSPNQVRGKPEDASNINFLSLRLLNHAVTFSVYLKCP